MASYASGWLSPTLAIRIDGLTVAHVLGLSSTFGNPQIPHAKDAKELRGPGPEGPDCTEAEPARRQRSPFTHMKRSLTR